VSFSSSSPPILLSSKEHFASHLGEKMPKAVEQEVSFFCDKNFYLWYYITQPPDFEGLQKAFKFSLRTLKASLKAF
jgi:hypothetical protein